MLFKDLLMANIDLKTTDEVSLIVDGTYPDKMMAKSAMVIYGSYFVVWFSGRMFSISEKQELSL